MTNLASNTARSRRAAATSRAFVLVPALVLSATLGPTAAHAQRATYLYMRGTDTLGTETLQLSDTGAIGVLSMKGQPRMEWVQRRVGGVLGGITLRAFTPGSDTPFQVASITMQGDSAIAEIQSGGRIVTQRIASKAGARPLINQSVLHMTLLAGQALARGAAGFDVFLASGAQTVPVTTSLVGDTLVIGLAGLQARAASMREPMPSVITTSQGMRVVRAANGTSLDAAAIARYNYDAPSDAPYTAEHVRIPSGRGYDLAATLTRPKGVAKAPVVVTISGSGPQDRDSRIALLPGYSMFREIADTLGRRGIAVLRYDDRAVGESGGMDGANNVTTVDASNDTRAVVAWLRTRSDIDGSRIALAGHSEGGIIAPMLAASDPEIRAIALLAGTAYDGRTVLNFQIGSQVAPPAGASESARDSVSRQVATVVDSLAKSSPWMGYFIAYDPRTTARRVRQPVLILQGETDRQVTPEQADTLFAVLRSSGNRAVTMRKFPKTNHLFLDDPSGAPSGYAALTNAHVRPAVLSALADWAVKTLR